MLRATIEFLSNSITPHSLHKAMGLRQLSQCLKYSQLRMSERTSAKEYVVCMYMKHGAMNCRLSCEEKNHLHDGWLCSCSRHTTFKQASSLFEIQPVENAIELVAWLLWYGRLFKTRNWGSVALKLCSYRKYFKLCTAYSTGVWCIRTYVCVERNVHAATYV